MGVDGTAVLEGRVIMPIDVEYEQLTRRIQAGYDFLAGKQLRGIAPIIDQTHLERHEVSARRKYDRRIGNILMGGMAGETLAFLSASSIAQEPHPTALYAIAGLTGAAFGAVFSK